MDITGLPGPLDDSHPSDTDHAHSGGGEQRQTGGRTQEAPRSKGKAAGRGSDSAGRRGGRRGDRQRKRRDEPHIPSRRAIFATLTRLTQLMGAGLLSTQRGNAMVQALNILLKHLPEDAAGQNGQVDSDLLRDVLRDKPDLLHAFGPLLSDEQLADLSDDDDADDDEDHDADDDRDVEN